MTKPAVRIGWTIIYPDGSTRKLTVWEYVRIRTGLHPFVRNY